MNVKDIISAVVTSMKPTISCLAAVVSGGGATVTIGDLARSVTSKLFVGEKVKLTYSGNTVYAVIASITTDTVIVTLPSNRAVPPSACEVILVFDHGHPIEIVNKIKQYTHHDTLKFEVFPRICLFHDIEERIGFDREVSCDLVIVTNTKPEYSAANRYTYSFDPTLTPLYNLFMEQLSASKYVQSESGDYFEHTKYDRLYWGKSGLYGNSGNIFNDFIDAIEINKLKFKTLKTC